MKPKLPWTVHAWVPGGPETPRSYHTVSLTNEEAEVWRGTRACPNSWREEVAVDSERLHPGPDSLCPPARCHRQQLPEPHNSWTSGVSLKLGRCSHRFIASRWALEGPPLGKHHSESLVSGWSSLRTAISLEQWSPVWSP